MRLFNWPVGSVILLLVFIGINGHLKAQDSSADKAELVTDRPDQTESATIVPVGSVQLETGLLYSSDKAEVAGIKYGASSFSIPNNLFRIGILKPVELRVIAGEFSSSRASVGDVSVAGPKGLSAIALGTKIKFWDEKGFIPETAILAHVTLPVGGEEVRPPEPIYDFRFSLAHTLSDNLALGYNVGGEYDPFTDEFTGLYTLSLGIGLTDTFGVFGEFFGDFGSSHEFDAGLTYLITDLIQYDLSGGFGLTDEAPDFFISTGITIRLFN